MEPLRSGGESATLRQHAPGKNKSDQDIIVSGIGKTYLTESGQVIALDDINFTVEHGSFISLLGPSGCGKTTLLRIMGGLLRPSQGEILVGGRPLYPGNQRGPDKGIINSIGFVFQDPNLLPWRSIIRNVTLPLELQKASKSERTRRAQAMLELVGLDTKLFAQAYPRQLSGGMRQRVAIARSLVYDPLILLMDEPFGALDAMTRETMNLELQRIWQESGKTVILVTHSLQEAVFLSDKVIMLSSRPGRISDTVTIDLPRPRTRAMLEEGYFNRLVGTLRQKLEEGY